MKQKNRVIGMLIVGIFILTGVFMFYSLQEKEDPIILVQETPSQPDPCERLHGTIKEVRVEADGVYLSLLTRLPVPTNTLTPEEYDTYTPETFPMEEKVWKFFVPLEKQKNMSINKGEDLSVSFSGIPSESEYREVQEIWVK